MWEFRKLFLFVFKFFRGFIIGNYVFWIFEGLICGISGGFYYVFWELWNFEEVFFVFVFGEWDLVSRVYSFYEG